MRALLDMLERPIDCSSGIQARSKNFLWRDRQRKDRRCCSAILTTAALLPTLSIAAPTVVEETARITAPEPNLSFPLRAAVEGDTIIAVGRRQDSIDPPIDTEIAYLFQRQSNGTWTYVRPLAQVSCDTGEVAEDICAIGVDIRNGIAVVSTGSSGPGASRIHVFERTAAGWIEAPSNATSGPGDAAVGTGAFVTSEQPQGSGTYDARVFQKNAAGTWTLVATTTGDGPAFCDPFDCFGGDIDMSAGNRFIVADENTAAAHIYEPTSGGWTRTATLTSPIAGQVLRGAVAIDDQRAFVSSHYTNPVHVFNRNVGTWEYAVDIAPPDSRRLSGAHSLSVDDLVAIGFPIDQHRGGSVGVFRRAASGAYEHVARLVGSDSGPVVRRLGSHVDIDVNGSTARVVAVARNHALYVFDLDNVGTTPAPLQDDFEQGHAANWTPIPGSSFSIVNTGSNVYRQSFIGSSTGSFMTSIDWTNQAIQADVKPTAFNGANRWVGLAVRRTDANNYYYVTLRQSNVLELKRMQNGSFVTLASTTVPVTLNRSYKLRLEAVGTLVRAYVDGRLTLQAHDNALTHGHAGVLMWQTRADFDNVILSQNPHLTLMEEDFEFSLTNDEWSVGSGVWSNQTDGTRVLAQTSTAGDARVVNRVDAANQIVQTRVKATSYAAGTGSRWFGLMARYVDDRNYYYVTMRSDNTISLRKLVNGSIHILDSAPLTISTNAWYTLRLEAVGQSLRVYVGDRLVLEAQDASFPTGKYGMVMYKAAARYDDFTTWEP